MMDFEQDENNNFSFEKNTDVLGGYCKFQTAKERQELEAKLGKYSRDN